MGMNHKVAVVAAAVAAGTIRVISVFEGSEEKRSAVGSRGHGLLKQIDTKKKKVIKTLWNFRVGGSWGRKRICLPRTRSTGQTILFILLEK